MSCKSFIKPIHAALSPQRPRGRVLSPTRRDRPLSPWKSLSNGRFQGKWLRVRAFRLGTCWGHERGIWGWSRGC